MRLIPQLRPDEDAWPTVMPDIDDSIDSESFEMGPEDAEYPKGTPVTRYTAY